jgi:hypothetical protein
MTPPADLVRQLHDFDSTLRIRWATFSARWLIEVKAAPRQPSWITEQPNPQRNDKQRDIYQGWLDGYLPVSFVAPECLRWEQIAPHLRDLVVIGRKNAERLADRLEALDEEDEAKVDKHISAVALDGAKEMYDRMSWADGRTLSMYEPDPLSLMEERDGYRVVDRRVKV